MARVKRQRRKGAAASHRRGENARWVRSVKTVSTFPPPGTFQKDAESIARIMASPRVSPKGLGSAIRMVQFYLNRGGSGLGASRRRTLEKAKRLLQQKRAAREAGRRRSSRISGARSSR